MGKIIDKKKTKAFLASLRKILQDVLRGIVSISFPFVIQSPVHVHLLYIYAQVTRTDVSASPPRKKKTGLEGVSNRKQRLQITLEGYF
jgi:hypothetical protein